MPDAASVTNCVISGAYYYIKEGFRVDVLRNFVRVLKSTTQEQKRVIMANLHMRLDSVARYTRPQGPPLEEEDIPF